jgi:acyl carrier protein
MKKAEFLEKIRQEIDTKIDLDDLTRWQEIPGYDSMAIMGLIALIDECFGKKLRSEEFEQMKTVGDLLNRLGVSFEE